MNRGVKVAVRQARRDKHEEYELLRRALAELDAQVANAGDASEAAETRQHVLTVLRLVRADLEAWEAVPASAPRSCGCTTKPRLPGGIADQLVLLPE